MKGHSLVASSCLTVPVIVVNTVVIITIADQPFVSIITTASVIVMSKVHEQLTVALQDV